MTSNDRALVAGQRLTPLVRAALSADLPNPLERGRRGIVVHQRGPTLFLARAVANEVLGSGS